MPGLLTMFGTDNFEHRKDINISTTIFISFYLPDFLGHNASKIASTLVKKTYRPLEAYIAYNFFSKIHHT